MLSICKLIGLLLFSIIAPTVISAQETSQRATFSEAHRHWSAGNLDAASTLFRKTADGRYVLSDYSLYYLADIAFRQKRWQDSRGIIQRITGDFPNSLWRDETEMLNAKISHAQGHWGEAIDNLRSLRQRLNHTGNLAEESWYLEAQAQESLDNVTEAYGTYQRLRSLFPHSRWTARARDAQKRLRQNDPDVFAADTAESLQAEADRLNRESQYRAAEQIYRRLLADAQEQQSRRVLLKKLADLYLATRQRDQAIPILRELAADSGNADIAPWAYFHMGQILWNRNENAEALEHFRTLLERYPKNAYAPRSEYASGDIHESFGDNSNAIMYYRNVTKKYPNSSAARDAAWRLAWLFYKSGQFAEAAIAFRHVANLRQPGPYGTAAIYWQARSAENRQDSDAAVEIYRRLVNGGSDLYYQLRASRRLERLNVSVELPQPRKPAPVTVFEVLPPPEGEFHYKRANELGELGLHRLAVRELNAFSRLRGLDTPTRQRLMHEYFRNHSYRQSLALAQQLPLDQHERDYYSFPQAYWGLIEQRAKEMTLDPYLVLGLIRQESLFDARARSPAAALGLMQIIPPTAARLAGELQLPVPSEEQLFEAEFNVRLGTLYLRNLLQRYDQKWYKAIAAYNAGEAAVDRWNRTIDTDDEEEFVERIPYHETRGYVKIVLRNHHIYKQLYE